MEQPQIQVRFSLGTKLLMSLVTLLLIAIGILNVSTILLLVDDKKAYTYQTQSTFSLLAANEFKSLGQRAINTLKVALASTHPTHNQTPEESSTLRSILSNQSELQAIHLKLYDTERKSLNHYAHLVNQDFFQSLGTDPSEYDLTPERMEFIQKELGEFGFSFFNLSIVGRPPFLGLAIADRNAETPQGEILIGVGVLSLSDFGKELKGNNITIANYDGWVLYDTDLTDLFSQKNLSQDPLFLAAMNSRLTVGTQEFEFDHDRWLGSYTRPGLNLAVLSRTNYHTAMASAYGLTEKFILLGCMIIGIAILFSIFFSKSLTRPLNQLYEATRHVARGKFDLKLESKSQDEIGALSGSFNIMSDKIQALIAESIKKTKLENELAIASTVQQNLIPSKPFSNDQFEIVGDYHPADECGGDWWGFFHQENHLALMIADATGHGIPSALITASARSCFSVMNMLAQEDPDFTFSPGAMLSFANRVIHEASGGKINMTFFIAVVQLSDLKMTYSSAGHNPPWLFQYNNGNYKLKSLTAKGTRLGETPTVPPYSEKSIQLQPGDTLFLYTDGIIEGTNSAGEEFGKKRLRKLVEKTVQGGPQKVVDQLMQDFNHHNTGKSFDDDVTLAVAKFK